MASVSRTALFGKIHKVLKKYYKPVAPPAERTVLEHLLFACVLEDARYEPAEEAFAALRHTFYDWNEVRVTSISELSEVMAVLPDPRAAANRIKRVLHSIFEELYCFDLEDKRKKNLGPTVKWLEKMDGTTRFVVAYVVQAALDGHSIPRRYGHDGRAPRLGPGDRQGSGRRRSAGHGTGRRQEQGRGVRLPAASARRRLPGQSVLAPGSRDPPGHRPRGREAVSPASSASPRNAGCRRAPPRSLRRRSRDQPRKKKAEAAKPAAAAEAKTAESPAAESKAGRSKPPRATAARESKPAEGKKAAGAASKKAAESSHESPAPRKPKARKPNKPSKPEKAEKPTRPRRQKRPRKPKNTPRPRSRKDRRNTRSESAEADQNRRRPQTASANANLGRRDLRNRYARIRSIASSLPRNLRCLSDRRDAAAGSCCGF